MAIGLSTLTRRFLLDEGTTRQSIERPVLLWETPESSEGSSAQRTKLLLDIEDALEAGAVHGEPLVFILEKNPGAPSSGTSDLTLGRTDRNDIILPHESVSRAHACFRQDPVSKSWKLLDVGSSNGTWVENFRLPPHQPALLPDCSTLRFGNVEVRYFTPASFFNYLAQMVGEPDAVPLAREPEKPSVHLTRAELDTLMGFYLKAMQAFDDCALAGGSPSPALVRAREAARDTHDILSRWLAALKPPV